MPYTLVDYANLPTFEKEKLAQTVVLHRGYAACVFKPNGP